MAARNAKAADKAVQTDATASAEITPQTVQEATEIAATVESDADSVVAESEPNTEGNASAEEAAQPEFIEVVVRPKHTVTHGGEHYGENESTELPRADAERLKRIGFVDYLSDLQDAAQVSQGVNVTRTGGVVVTQEG